MVDNAPKVHFHEWCQLVCGNYRSADSDVLEDRWSKGWLPYQATADLERKKLFRRKRRDERPFWEAWKSERATRKERRRAMSRLDMRWRLAKALLAEIELLRRHRMEPADLRFLNDLEASCRRSVTEKLELLRSKRERRLGQQFPEEEAERELAAEGIEPYAKNVWQGD